MIKLLKGVSYDQSFMYLAISSLWSRKSLWDVKKCDKMIQKNKLAAHLHPDNDDTIAPSPTSDASHAIPNGRDSSK